MIATLIVIVSSASAILGLIHSHKAPAARASFLGLTPLGVSLVLLALLGTTAGVIKEIRDGRKARVSEEQSRATVDLIKQVARGAEEQNRTMLNIINQVASDVKVLQGAQPGKDAAEQLGDISHRLSNVTGLQWIKVEYDGEKRDVIVDGQVGGKTGNVLIVTAGTHDFRLKGLEDYYPQAQTLTIVGTSLTNPRVVPFKSTATK